MKDNSQGTIINDGALDQVSGGTGSETAQKELWTCEDCGGTRNVTRVLPEIDPSLQHAQDN